MNENTDNPLDQFELADDGTMDTVIRCRACGAEARFNYDSEQADAVDPEDNGDRYDAFVEWCREQMADDHECDRDDTPMFDTKRERDDFYEGTDDHD